MRRQNFPGHGWIPERELEAQLGLRPGDRAGPDRLVEGLRRLLSFRFIESAEPPRVEPVEGGRSVDIDWPVEVRPLVREVKLDLRPAGRRPALEARGLREGLRTRPGEPLVRRDLAADRDGIRSRYVQEGFFQAEVTSTERLLSPGAVAVEIRVDEGPQVAIVRIEVRGNSETSRHRVLSLLRTRPRILFGLVSRGIYIPERFQEDLERVRRFYRGRGYLEARVALEPPRFSPDRAGLTLGIAIEEGPRYQLTAVRIRGNSPAVPTELLERQVRTRAGGPYDGQSLEEDRWRLVLWYEEHYDRVPQIELLRVYALDPSDTGVKAVFEVDERGPVQVGRVEVEGNTRTRDRLARTALTVLPGSPLTGLRLAESSGRLRALGLFDPDTIAVHVPESGGVRDVGFRVEERRTGFFQLGGGASSGEGGIAYLSLTQPNFDLFALPGPRRPWSDAFSGGGQFLQLELAPGTRESEFTFRFEEPYFFNSAHSLSLLGNTQIYDRRDYRETRVGGEIGLRRFWDAPHRLSTRLGYVLEDVDISSVSSRSPAGVTGARGHTLLAYPDLRLTYSDLRVHPQSGPAGLFAEARGDLAAQATGSQARFARALVSADLYRPVSEWINALLPGEPLSETPALRHVLRLGGRLGWMDGLEGEEAPIFERFFLGGPRSLRGFDYRGVGPEASGVRVGGQAYFQGTVEYSFPLFIPELRGVALFDFADVERDFSRLSTGRIRTAAGGGIRVRARLGGQSLPVDLYWVQALSRESGDDVQLFTFTIGLGF